VLEKQIRQLLQDVDRAHASFDVDGQTFPAVLIEDREDLQRTPIRRAI
jgi:hypothetical protein